MKILVVCNGFKGTLTADEANLAIKDGVLRWNEHCEVICFPMADGGQGSAQIAGSLLEAQEVLLEVVGPDGIPAKARYWRTGQRALVELAEASGLVKSDLTRPLKCRTTYGTGEVIQHAIQNGAREIEVFLGGSGTNDAGVGLAKALGVKFLNGIGEEIPGPDGFAAGEYPGEQVCEIAGLDISQWALSDDIHMRVIVDVDNPLTGSQGASFIYGPQKGGTPEELEELDRAFQSLQQVTGLSPTEYSAPGHGAAGGAGFGLVAFLGAQIVSGPSYFLDLMDFHKHLPEVDIVITGEGKLDQQSVEGKLFAEIVERSKGRKPVVALVGVLEPQDLLANSEGVWGFDTRACPADLDYSEQLSVLAYRVASERFQSIVTSCEEKV